MMRKELDDARQNDKTLALIRAFVGIHEAAYGPLDKLDWQILALTFFFNSTHHVLSKVGLYDES